MKTYKFHQFNNSITGPVIELVSFTHSFTKASGLLTIRLVTPNASQIIELAGFSYNKTTTEADFLAFATEALKEFEVN